MIDRAFHAAARILRVLTVPALGAACGDAPKNAHTGDDSTIVDTADSAGHTADTSAESDSTETTEDSDSAEETAEPRCVGSGPWVYVAAGYNGSCGIHEDGCMECWPAVDTGAWTPRVNDTGYYGQTGNLVPPDGAYSAVDLGRCNEWGTHSCAIRKFDGGIECWGSDAWRAASPPSGEWTALALIDDESCALGVDGRIACWGRFIGPGSAAAYSMASDYVAISECDYIVCGLAADGRADCWDGVSQDPIWTYAGPWISIENWYLTVYGVGVDGSVYNNYGMNTLPTTDLPAVDVCLTGGRAWGCVLDVAGGVECTRGLQPVPDATFSSIACGLVWACGITTDGQALCWGNCDYGVCDVPIHE